MRADQPYKHQELFLFTYNIPGKYIELSDELAEAFQMEKIFKNMPDSFAEQFVLEEDRPGFCQMYYDIDAGASFATCDFRINGAQKLESCMRLSNRHEVRYGICHGAGCYRTL